jgi:hypothetical protein
MTPYRKENTRMLNILMDYRPWRGKVEKKIQRKTTGDRKENYKFVLLSRDKTEI